MKNISSNHFPETLCGQDHSMNSNFSVSERPQACSHFSNDSSPKLAHFPFYWSCYHIKTALISYSKMLGGDTKGNKANNKINQRGCHHFLSDLINGCKVQSCKYMFKFFPKKSKI